MLYAVSCEKLERSLGGTKEKCGRTPDNLSFVTDTNKEAIAIQVSAPSEHPVVAVGGHHLRSRSGRFPDPRQ